MIALLFVLFLFGPQEQTPTLKTIAALAASLSEGNPSGAMSVFDKSLANYDTIATNVAALTAQAEISCSIDPVDQNGNEVEVEWFMLIRSKQENGPAERRQVNVKLVFAQSGKAWKIVSITPQSILDPPKQ